MLLGKIPKHQNGLYTMIFMVKIAVRDQSGRETYKTIPINAQGWSGAISVVAEQLGKSERMVRISEAGYQ